ncbi:50S ribosomal protein L21 [Subsaximicrobium wynnwilliamsii]|uniref:Large ribosomal subunit protein bL21 n=1 Tax=Subsaximicrobium wynnwilliamsii TaxID=291179 RepID=A0A5C6ZGV2_9FLAO|nr:50S ribosomal protein L21 [Subsaximicrobium wynnwilliamsii]TXD83752.1 50S ribosomal protein L21 [Subsaximicrobium wynnwilliamsii]TXD89365.1 50S ribosomal protein L21 [Subsaximicrobium wynnwilliamsii]TXE03588.1 50S ribosomal protein L21 [Subsaximicrobium wynnwilliamsii]
MYAIVEIAGQQFKVEKDQKVFVNRLGSDEGSKIDFDSVLLIGDGDNITLGAPAIDGALISAKVLRHLKGDKVIVFKKKRRKGYRVKNGHRQALSEIVIESIVGSGAKKAEKTEKAKPAKTEQAAPVKDTKTSTSPAAKTTPKKETKKEADISENLVTRAEHRADEAQIEINIDKVLHNVGTALKADADDLKMINGIGPAYEERLNELGIYTFEQISKLKAADREELSAVDGITRDKIESEEWVKQAKALLKDKK